MKNAAKYKKGEFGFVPISKVVDEFLNDSFNDGRKYYTNFLKMAKRAWKKLYYMDLGITEKVVVYINKNTATAEIPAHSTLITAVFIVDDCRMKHQLSSNINLNTTEIPEKPKGCGCTACNCDNDLCGSANAVNFYTEMVDIDGTEYPKVYKTKLCSNGDIIEEITETLPKGDGAGGITIVTRTYNKYIGKVEVKPCGCVVNTVENNNKCAAACGCKCSNITDYQLPVGNNKFGHFAVDLERGILHLINVKQDYVIIEMQSDGEIEGEEIMIPEYGIDTITSGIYWRSLRFRNVGIGEKNSAKIAHEVEIQELIEFLNPIDANGIKELQDHFMKW